MKEKILQSIGVNVKVYSGATICHWENNKLSHCVTGWWQEAGPTQIWKFQGSAIIVSED